MTKQIFRIFFFILNLLLVWELPRATAQKEVQLTIVEKATAQPLPGATVGFSPFRDMKKIKYMVSNSHGDVSIPIQPNGIYYEIRMVGFTQRNGYISPDTDTMLLEMEDAVIGLDEVTVSRSMAVRPLKLSPITTQHISASSLSNAGYSDLQQALQQETPGLNIRKVAFGNDLNMQGLDARHVLFLIDGERMTGDIAGNIDYERFNLHAIDRIEIIKGGSSALYGPQASGAVINLISKQTNHAIEIKAGARYGQMNERNYDNPQKKDFLYMFEKNVDRPNVQGWVSSGFKSGAFTSQTDVWYSQTDAFYLYQKENDSKTYTREANQWLRADTIIESKLERSPMGISGSEHITASQKLFFEPNANFKMQVYGTYFFMNTYDMVQDLVFTQAQDITSGVKVNYRIKNWVTATASLHTDYYDRYKRHERRDERKKVYESRILQPKLTLTSNYFPGHDLIVGIEHFTDELTSDRFVNRVMTSRALKETEYYFQDEWSITEKWLVSAGARTNFSPQFGFMWMPKLSAKYSPNTNWSFRTSLTKGYRSPTIKELFFNWDHLGMFMIKGNEELQPEKNKYASVGVEYTNTRFFINTTLYGNFFTNKIEGIWRIYDMQYNFEYTNLGNQNLLGGEVLSNWNITNVLSVNASYSYVNVSKTEGLQFNSTSPHATTAGIKYSYQKGSYRLNAGFTASYMGKKQFDVQDRLYIASEGASREAYFRCSLPAYTLCNVTLAQTFGDKLKVTLGIDNIFNYKPETLGSGLTVFSIPSTAGARGFIQIEFRIDNNGEQ